MNPGVDTVHAAVIGIDLHRGHLDPSVATMPLDVAAAQRVVAANRRLFDACRSAGIPVVHLITRYRDREEIRANPFWRTRAENPDNSAQESPTAARWSGLLGYSDGNKDNRRDA